MPCIVTDKVNLKIGSTTLISTLDNEIYILVQHDDLNSNIKINDIYKIGNWNYRVKNIDDISNSGLLYIKLEFSEQPQIFPSYTIEILNGESLTTDTVTPVKLNIKQKDGDIVLTEPLPVTFTSSDNAIASVDNNGLVTPVSVGNVNITVSLEFDLEVYDSISLTVKELPVVETYYLELIGSVQPDTEIKNGQTKTYTCVKKNSQGIAVEGATFDFTVNRGTTPTSAYNFTVLNDTQCTIKCNAHVNYIDLVATDRSDNTLTVSKNIKLRSTY